MDDDKYPCIGKVDLSMSPIDDKEIARKFDDDGREHRTPACTSDEGYYSFPWDMAHDPEPPGVIA